jgi:hypothetical protein
LKSVEAEATFARSLKRVQSFSTATAVDLRLVDTERVQEPGSPSNKCERIAAGAGRTRVLAVAVGAWISRGTSP